MKTLRHMLAGSLLALMLASPAAAHHVDTGAPASDADALAVFVREWQAQSVPLADVVLRQVVDPSPSGLAEVRNAIEVTILHMASLDVRECFATYASVVTLILDEHAASFALDTDPLLAAAHRAFVGYLATLLQPEMVASLPLCAPEDVA